MAPLFKAFIANLVRCADFLARQGHTAPLFDWVIVDSVSTCMLGLLLVDDARGTRLPRVA